MYIIFFSVVRGDFQTKTTITFLRIYRHNNAHYIYYNIIHNNIRCTYYNRRNIYASSVIEYYKPSRVVQSFIILHKNRIIANTCSITESSPCRCVCVGFDMTVLLLLLSRVAWRACLFRGNCLPNKIDRRPKKRRPSKIRRKKRTI